MLLDIRPITTILPIRLVMIHRCLILTSRFHAVVTVPQGLPVALVPEQLRITTVRDDMVNVRCLHIPAFLHALHTQRMCLQKDFSGFPPCIAISTTTCTAYLSGMQRFMHLAVFHSIGNQYRTARMLAGRFRTTRHHCSQGSSFFPKWP